MVLGTAAGVACERTPAVLSIAPASTTASLSFELSSGTEKTAPVASLVGFVVSRYPCDTPRSADKVRVWAMNARDGVGPASPPTIIRYGVAPPEYVTSTGPAALTEGCYEAYVTGADLRAILNYRVDRDGRVMPLRREQSHERDTMS